MKSYPPVPVKLLFEDKNVADVWTKRLLFEIEGYYAVVSVSPSRQVEVQAFQTCQDAIEHLWDKGIDPHEIVDSEAIEQLDSETVKDLREVF